MRQPIERAGYSWLIDALDLRCVPLDRECVIGSRQALSQSAGGVKVEVFTKGYAREQRPIDLVRRSKSGCPGARLPDSRCPG